MVNLNDFNQVAECVYKNERYSVRDNGEILRHSPIPYRKRPTDNIWKFGKVNSRTGYLELASVRIHRIVATAFHGEPTSTNQVVDHIDTNKENNRSENLRWVTRLKNILLNEITAKRIAYVCGSVEAFLNDPQSFKDAFKESNMQWMRPVSKEEAQICKENIHQWAKSDKKGSGKTLDEWIFSRFNQKGIESDKDEIVQSLTFNAIQKNWKTPTEFPLCPQIISDNPLKDYANNLKIGKIFSKNINTDNKIEDFAISLDKNSLCVIGVSTQPKPLKPFTLTQITFENSLFVHESLGSFFKRNGAEKYFTLALGKEWLGGEVDDDLS